MERPAQPPHVFGVAMDRSGQSRNFSVSARVVVGRLRRGAHPPGPCAAVWWCAREVSGTCANRRTKEQLRTWSQQRRQPWDSDRTRRNFSESRLDCVAFPAGPSHLSFVCLFTFFHELCVAVAARTKAMWSGEREGGGKRPRKGDGEVKKKKESRTFASTSSHHS